jgi:LPPG:FO 2-phospho-L-lactate transferase
VTALAGGVGGAKLLVGLDRALRGLSGAFEGAPALTAIVNTADDTEIYGVYVSPDVDIVTYWLAGMADTERGWGIRDDTFHAMEAIAALGKDVWFNLGDHDLGLCLFRTQALEAGQTLSAVTESIRGGLGIRARVLPMSDDRIRTHIHTSDGRRLPFQEYFVKERQRPEVTAVELEGIESAKPAPGVLDAVRDADTVVVCPSNPVVSIGPILSLPGVRDELRRHPKVVAVSPIVAGAALKGPADRMLRSLGMEASALSVARLYSDFVTKFVLDGSDEDCLPQVWQLGLEAQSSDTIMRDPAASERLVRDIFGLEPAS